MDFFSMIKNGKVYSISKKTIYFILGQFKTKGNTQWLERGEKKLKKFKKTRKISSWLLWACCIISGDC